MAAQENRLLLGSTIRHEEVTLQCYPPISWQPILSHIITGHPCQSSSRYCLVSEQATSHTAARARSYLWAWLIKNGPQEALGFNPHWPSGKSLMTTHVLIQSFIIKYLHVQIMHRSDFPLRWRLLLPPLTWKAVQPSHEPTTGTS